MDLVALLREEGDIVTERLAHWAETAGDRPFFYYGEDDVTLTYADFGRRTDAIASNLAANGVAKGDRVSVFCANPMVSALVMFGTWKAGALYCPIGGRHDRLGRSVARRENQDDREPAQPRFAGRGAAELAGRAAGGIRRASGVRVPETGGLSSTSVLFEAEWVRAGSRQRGAYVARMAPEPSAVPVFPHYDLAGQFELIGQVAAGSCSCTGSSRTSLSSSASPDCPTSSAAPTWSPPIRNSAAASCGTWTSTWRTPRCGTRS